MNDSLAAVVVTFNRFQLLSECLDALLRQTRPLARIVLVDNASTDGTPELLQARGYLSNPVIDYIRLPRNTGGAGGFHAGLQRALEGNYDWLWVMDDDAEPADDAAEALAPFFNRAGISGLASLVFGLNGQPQREHRGTLKLCNATLRAHEPLEAGIPTECQEISFASFVGLAVPKHAVARIGLPKQELFLRGDDLEYCIRLNRLGPLLLVPGSRILHKDNSGSAQTTRTRFGRASSRPPLKSAWIGYIALRNLIWMRRHYCGTAIAARFAIRQLARNVIGTMIFDDERLLRIRLHWMAVMDGFSDTFDNDKPRTLLNR